MWRGLAAGTAAVAVLSGCVISPTGQVPDQVPQSRVETGAVQAAESFWSSQLPSLYGRPYRPLDPDRIVAFTARSGDVLVCGGEALRYRDVAGNAFAAPCPEGITVAWDASALFPRLREAFGDVAPAIVLAHEWGHVAQFQAGVRLPTVYAEQQADCWAGAWAAAVGEDPPAELADLATEPSLDGALATLIFVRDPVGTRPVQEGAHGTGFDRVRAFQEGYERGAATCAGYADQPPTLVDLPFRNPEELATGGNLPLEALVPLAVTDLDAFYEAQVPGFEPLGPLELGGFEERDQELLRGLAQIGDSAPATLLGLRWAQTAREAAGVEAGDESGAALQRACMTGGWLASLLVGRSASGQISLSPGDLDESILGLLALAQIEAPEVGGGSLSGFELVATFRQGVIQGFDSCAR